MAQQGFVAKRLCKEMATIIFSEFDIFGSDMGWSGLEEGVTCVEVKKGQLLNADCVYTGDIELF